MNCTNCGTQLTGSEFTCPACGAPVQQGYQYQQAPYYGAPQYPQGQPYQQAPQYPQGQIPSYQSQFPNQQ